MHTSSQQSQGSKQPLESQLTHSQGQEQRKALIIQINPRIKPIFEKVDFDFSQLFIQLSLFNSDNKENSDRIRSQQMKKNFFVRNYEKILIHFFQFLFDFQLETLQFTQKHETILSFGQWLENEVIFQFPQKINLLNKKKEEIKKKAQSITQTKIIQLVEVKSPKRSFEPINDHEEKNQVGALVSPKKKKILQKEEQSSPSIQFCSKYDDSTNHTAFYTPKQTFAINQPSQIVKQASFVNETQRNQNIQKRKIYKVKESKPQLKQTQNGKTQKRQTYRLKETFKQKKGSQKNKISQKQKSQKNLGKKKNELNLKLKEIIEEERGKDRPQIIVLQSSGEQKIQSQKKNDSVIQLSSSCTLVHQLSVEIIDEKKINLIEKTLQRDQTSVRSESTKKSLQKAGAQSRNQTNRQQQTKKALKSSSKTIQQEAKNLERLCSIVEDIKISTNLQDKDSLEYERILREKQERKLHNFRSRLSGVFRYPEKRFYIFPEMVQVCQGQNEMENRRVLDYESLEKSRSMRKDNSNQRRKY